MAPKPRTKMTETKAILSLVNVFITEVQVDNPDTYIGTDKYKGISQSWQNLELKFLSMKTVFEIHV